MENRFLSRGKRIDNGEWVEGCYVLIDNHYYIYTGSLCNGGLYVVAERFEIQIDTLCQCTGYEGIYENDIFRYEDEDYVIKWSDDSLSWEATSLETDVSVPLGDINPDYMVVIGNEIDNPELLEVQK